jgi:hypothetical protein
MGSLILPFLVAGVVNIILAVYVWDVDDDAAWQRREQQLRAQGIAPLRPDNWSALHRRQKIASIMFLVFISCVFVVIVFGFFLRPLRP